MFSNRLEMSTKRFDLYWRITVQVCNCDTSQYLCLVPLSTLKNYYTALHYNICMPALVCHILSATLDNYCVRCDTIFVCQRWCLVPYAMLYNSMYVWCMVYYTTDDGE